MKRRAVFVFCCWLGGHAAMAAGLSNQSLFFTANEIGKIETIANHATLSATDNGDLRLGAVFYYNPGDWTLWLQGQKITPATHRDDIQVLEVAPDYVRLRLAAASGLAAHEIILKPYQSYRLSTGDVLDGSASSVSLDFSK